MYIIYIYDFSIIMKHFHLKYVETFGSYICKVLCGLRLHAMYLYKMELCTYNTLR